MLHFASSGRRLAVASFALMSLLLLAVAVAAQNSDSSFTPHFKPTLDVPRINSVITIDGALTEPAWLEAGHSDYFHEVDPGDQIHPGVKSEFRIFYDEHNLYVALIAHDDPRAIRASWSDRDNIFRDDYFGILIDSYGDNNSGYEVFVNPYGLQGDLRVTNSSGNEDMSFNMIFNSRGMITDSGYQVEIAIPFSSLRFPDKEEQTWRCQVWRDRQRDARYRYAWSAQNRNDPCWLCNWGTLTGIRGVHPSTNLEILPNLIATQSGTRLDADAPGSKFDNADPKADASLTLKYGVTSSTTLEATINPDFSQVESDAGQIDVNSTFALSFPEARPFFAEGSDLYDTWIPSIYTRSINDPDAAAKFVGRLGKTSVAYTFARDRHSPLLIPLLEESDFGGLGQSWTNILRLRRSVGNGSNFGMLATDRRLDGGGSGSDLGLDASLRFWKNYQFRIQSVASRTVEPNDSLVSAQIIDTTFDAGRHTTALDGESYWGHAIFASVRRDARHFSEVLNYTEYSPTFRADNGFVVQNDYRQVVGYLGWSDQYDKGWLVSWGPWIETSHLWRYDDPVKRFKDEYAQIGFNAEIKGQTSVWANYLNSREVFREKTFEGISKVYFGFQNRYLQALAGGAEVTIGRGIARNLDTPEMGRQLYIYGWVNFKPTRRLLIAPSVNFARMKYEQKYLDTHPGTDPQIFKGSIFRTRITYQVSREWYLRTVLQYDQFSDQLDIEPLISYQLNPFTIFYAGVNGHYQYYDRMNYDPQLPDSKWELSSRQVFVKLQYLWHL